MHGLHRIIVSLVTVAALSSAGHARPKGIDASRCLETKVQVAQEFGNVFSRTIAFQINGFDDFVRRVSGTGAYKVLAVSPQQIVFDSSFLYDGAPASAGQTSIKEGGRQTCWKGDCSVAIDASGVSINPLLWGAPHGMLHVGQTWEVDIATPWELGPAGKQTVTVLSIDSANDGITLEREGEGSGDSVGEIKKLPLVKDKKTYVAEVSAGKAKWSGYTTFQRGIVISDVLVAERPVTVTSKEFGQSSGRERQYILLNAAPLDLVRKNGTAGKS